jgi:hypothetical protein
VRWAEAEGPAAGEDGDRRETLRCGVYLNFPHLTEEELVSGILLMRQAGEQLDGSAVASR